MKPPASRSSHGADGPDDDTVPTPVRDDLEPITWNSFDAEADTVIRSRPEHDGIEFPPERVETRPRLRAGSRFGMRIGSHPPIALDVPAYIGRRPTTPRIAGRLAPRLVVVPSPSKEVSSTHVEVREEADTVVVTDLRSTNGTTVWLPGLPPRALRQGESIVTGAGARVEIGDGIRIDIIENSAESPLKAEQ